MGHGEGNPVLRRWARSIVPLLASLLVAAMALAPATGTHDNALAKAHSETISVMPMGDSITGSTGCWRAGLWTKLQASGRGTIDFAGKGIGPDCETVFDDDAVAFSGTRVVDMSPKDKFVKSLKKQGDMAQVALMHLGSNDIRDDKSIRQILDGYTTVVGLLREANPDAVILVAQLIPITETPMDEECPQCPDKVDELNAAIPQWADRMDSGRSPVAVVDQNEGFDPDDDLSDGLHPDDSGCRKMADKWYKAIDKALA